MKKLRVYIAGPLGANTSSYSEAGEGMMKNVNTACEAFWRLQKLGFSPFCPHLSVFLNGCFKEERESAHGTVITRILSEADYTPENTTWQDWIDIDLPWVAASDCLLRLPGLSKGASAEVDHAIANNVPVFFTEAALVAWKESKEKEATSLLSKPFSNPNYYPFSISIVEHYHDEPSPVS